MPIDVGPVEREGLAAYLARIVALDDRAAVRLQARGTVAGVWSGPPFGVLAVRPVALLAPCEVDTTVSAQRLREAVQRIVGTGDSLVALPPSVLGPPWAALLPPQTGWAFEAEVPVAVVVDQVGVMVEGFRRRVDLLPVAGRTPAALEALAEEGWRGPSVGGAPMRAAHAAAQLGFLGREGVVVGYRSGGWRRLGCPGGSVLARVDEPGAGGGLGSFDVLGAFSGR